MLHGRAWSYGSSISDRSIRVTRTFIALDTSTLLKDGGGLDLLHI